MKIILSTLSMLTLTTSIGTLNPILNSQIKTININDSEPKKYDGENKIINTWIESPRNPTLFVFIKSNTFNTWFKLFSLHDYEKLREKIYYDMLSFPFQGNGSQKCIIYKLSELIINDFANLLKIRGHNTYGIKLCYQFGILVKKIHNFHLIVMIKAY